MKRFQALPAADFCGKRSLLGQIIKDLPTPIHLIEAPTPGSGKSLLAELISIITLGSFTSCTTLTSNEEESRKKLTAIRSRGASVISIDNLKGGLWSAQVAAAITAEEWEDRQLAKTTRKLPANIPQPFNPDTEGNQCLRWT